MSYVIKAVLSNPRRPEHGQISIPFPIPDSEYDRTIELLEAVGSGAPTIRDCRVDELDSGYPILSRLLAQSVSVDELDYLAKRLDSFCEGGSGTVTPYGVVYDNGMVLEQLYNGRQFPGCLYTPPVMALEVTPKQGLSEGQNPEYLCLPAAGRQIERALLRAGIQIPSDAQVRLDFDELPEKVAPSTAESRTRSRWP